MAVATGTAILIGSLAASAAGAISSAKQAKDARNAMNDANDAAEDAYNQARKNLDVNFYEGLSINKEPYEREREANLATSAAIMNAVREGDQRGVGASAQQVLTSSREQQQDIANRQSIEQTNLNKAIKAEDSRLRDTLSELKLKEAQGAQAAAGGYQQLQVSAAEGVASNLQQASQVGLEALPLYGKAGSNETGAPVV